MTSTTMKEMSYSELNSQIEELKQQQQALATKLSMMVSEMEHRKEEAINNWKQHTAMVLEDTKVLLEMGIDPQSLVDRVKENYGSKQIEPTYDEISCENHVNVQDKDTDKVNDTVEVGVDTKPETEQVSKEAPIVEGTGQVEARKLEKTGKTSKKTLVVYQLTPDKKFDKTKELGRYPTQSEICKKFGIAKSTLSNFMNKRKASIRCEVGGKKIRIGVERITA